MLLVHLSVGFLKLYNPFSGFDSDNSQLIARSKGNYRELILKAHCRAMHEDMSRNPKTKSRIMYEIMLLRSRFEILNFLCFKNLYLR